MRFVRSFLFHPLLGIAKSAGIFGGLFLLTLAASAQSVQWQADPGSPGSIQLVFENCVPEGRPDLPAIPGATLTFTGQADSVRIENLQMTRSVVLTYIVRARQSGPLQIPAFSVKTDKGTQRVTAFNAAAPAASLTTVASSKLIPERTSVWAGEVFGLAYQLSLTRRNSPQVQPTFEWNAAPLVAEDWSKHEVVESSRRGEPGFDITFRTRAYAKTPNPVKLEAVSHLLHIQTGTVGAGFFSQPRMEPISVTSDQPVIEVKPLPPAPPGFSGAVGQFQLVSKVVPEKAAVGEPITWTIELSGTGNWPDIAGLPARDVSNDFRVVQPKAKRTPGEGKLFDMILAEDVVLVPTKAGSYALGPVTFSYFDPKTGRYETKTVERKTVTIAAPPAAQFNLKAAPDNANEEPAPKTKLDEGTAPARGTLAIPPLPAGIPRDPLSGADPVRAPMTRRVLGFWLLVPVASFGALWLALAIRRARSTDPERPRRDAHARIARTLTALQESVDSVERTKLILAWQHDSALLWQISHAAPRATAVPNPAWSTLWQEADRALYGTPANLPVDWIARAQEALVAKRVPGFRPLRLFLPRNLFPFAATVAMVAAGAITLLHAADAANGDGLAAYRRGDFAAAEKAWRATLTKTPTDWIAHHNLSLGLAQQERLGEAAGHAVAAFVQHPDNASVRWHLALACGKAGFAPGGLASFLSPGPMESVAQFVSPAKWQGWLIAGAWACAVGFGIVLVNSYVWQRQGWRWLGASVAAMGAISAAVSTAGLLSYGIAADARAVIVARPGTLRSIPLEPDTTQKTTPLAAGSLALVTKAYPDAPYERWVNLSFENGQTGWVRKEDVVPLWK